MLSGKIGRYKYYKLKDMLNSEGCYLCQNKTKWDANLFNLNVEIEQHEKCIRCPIFNATILTRLYARDLAEYEMRYEDDGK